MSARGWLRRARLGLPTVLGLRPRGFFLPYRYAADIPTRAERGSYEAVERLFVAERERFAAMLDGLHRYAPAFAAIAADRTPRSPRWDQDWFPPLDAAIAYALVRDRAPRHIVEVGSGHSTRFLARALRDGAIAASLTAIDPAPRAGLPPEAALARMPVQHARLDLFETLGAGDLLFIDSSHLLMPGSDVDLLVNRVLPLLPPGVLVHLHDIFLPDDYPAAWAWRGYNEQLVVPGLLLDGGWEVLFASHFVASRMQAELAASAMASLPPPGLSASLWLARRGS